MSKLPPGNSRRRRSPAQDQERSGGRASPWYLALPFLLLTVPTAALELDGVFRQGGLVTGRTVPGAEVRLSGRPLPVTPDGVFLMGFGRNAPTGQKLVVDPPGEPARSYRLRIRERDYDVQRIDDLPQAMVHPDPEALARIREEQARVERARDHFTRIGGFREDFSWPVTGRVSGVYGTRRILNGESRQPHFGVDIAAPSGTPVRSPASGVVRLAEPDLYFSGGTVILDHGWGLTSTFLHLESLRVAEGEPVSRGQVLGQAGATGRATGPHLDWRINLGEKRLDPALLAGPMPGGESGLRTGDAGP